MAQTHKKAKPAHSQAPQSVLKPQHLTALLIAALWMLVLAAYSNSFQTGLVYDNTPIVLKDPRVHAVTAGNVGLILGSEYWYPPTGNGLYRPVTTLSYLFNYAILGSGDQPSGYHLVNYLIHGANATLAFLLGLALFGESVPAFAMAALWAVHPVLTESVTNVIGRADLMAAFGILAALLCFARGSRPPVRKRWIAAAAISSAIAIGSKESGIVVMGAVLLFDLAFRREKPWRPRLPLYAAVVVPCLLYLAARHFALAASPPMRIPFTDNPEIGAGFAASRLTAIKVIGKELALLLWPARLSCDYSYNAIPLSTGPDAGVSAGAGLLAALAAAAFWCYRRRPPVFFLIALGLVALVPVSNLLFPTGTIMAERFLYLPALAFAGLLVYGAAALPGRSRLAGLAVLGAVAIAFSARTFARNFDWKDEQTLWTSAAAVEPAAYRPHSSLSEGDLETAKRETDLTLRILDPLPDRWNTPIPYINAGKVYSDAGDSRKAIDLLLRAERIQAALDPARKWFALDAQLGHDYFKTGQYDKAVEAFSRALRSRFSADVLSELAASAQARGDTRRAAVALFEGLEATQSTKYAGDLVALYKRDMPGTCAVLSAGEQYRLDRSCPVVKEHMCAASRELLASMDAGGQTQDAARIRANARRSGCGE